jgi:hypothetical protein
MRSTIVFLFFGLPAFLIICLLTIGGSRLLIDPTAATVTPCGDVVMRRHYPMAEMFNSRRPWVRYVQTITPLTPGHADGYLCREDNGHGQRYMHDSPLGFNKWDVRHFAKDCLTDPVGFVFEAQYTAYLFDVLPLRPVSISVSVPTAGTNCDKKFRSDSHEPR